MGKAQEKGKQIVKEFYQNHGYVFDKWGNMKSPSGKYRVKFNKNKMRYERRLKIEGRPVEWVRSYSIFWKDVKGLENLRVMLEN